MLIAVNYHYVRPAFDAPYPGIHGNTPAQFESQLKLLSQIGTFVGAAQIRAAVAGGAPLPPRAFVVTFDDGLREQHEHAWKVLERLGIPAIFFINTQPIAEGRVCHVHKTHLLRAHVAPGEFVERLQAAAARHGTALPAAVDEAKATAHYKYDDAPTARLKYLLNMALPPQTRDALVDVLFEDVFAGRESEISRQLYMNRRQIAELAQRESVGTHAHEHLPLGLLPAEEAERQLAESVNLLSEWTGRPPYALSYPYGSRDASSPAVAAAARRQGIEFAFTMERAGNPDLRAPLHLARFDNNDMPGGKAAAWPAEKLFDAVTPRSWYAA
jgi:peptidoglycan/xylan/chitin deacetylase (PgdA/CDA1 family)